MEVQGLTLKQTTRHVWLVVLASVGFILVGHFLRQLNITLNPLAWASAEIISALLSFTIAANVLVRYHGTGNRVSLLLGLTFGITGFFHLGAIFELYHYFMGNTGQLRAPISWMAGQTVLSVLLLAACAINRQLPWPRDPRRSIFAVLGIAVSASCMITLVYLIFLDNILIYPRGAVLRPWDLLLAANFLAAAFVLNRRMDDDRLAFDVILVAVAGVNAASHLIASQSARVLDASAAGAEFVNTVGFMLLLGATLLDNARLFGQVRTLAISDSLTGLANYRRLVDILQNETERSGRTNRPFSILLMDLDGLKLINDRYGHLTGSRALCRVAEILRLSSRSIDTAARYGGDEFALVLPETREAAAHQVAGRVRNCLEADEEVPRLSLSIGVATFPVSGVTVQQLLEQADRALYEMKGKLKNNKAQKHRHG